MDAEKFHNALAAVVEAYQALLVPMVKERDQLRQLVRAQAQMVKGADEPESEGHAGPDPATYGRLGKAAEWLRDLVRDEGRFVDGTLHGGKGHAAFDFEWGGEQFTCTVERSGGD